MVAAIDGFDLFRRDLGPGGGTCIYVRNDLETTRLELNVPPVEGIEDLWLKIQYRKFPSIIVGAMYRHPHALVSSFDYISDVLQNVSLYDKNIFLLGDLNDDLFKSNNKLNRILKSSSFEQLIVNPTRITSNSKTLIDVIITNNKNLVEDAHTYSCHLSDHNLVSVTINLKKPPRTPVIKTFRSLKNYIAKTDFVMLFWN